MKVLIVAKHPESSQSTYELLEHLIAKNSHDELTVYGVQNITPNKARTISSEKVKFVDVDDNGNKLDVDVLHKELTTHNYDVLVVIHAVNIVATIVKSLEGTLEGLSVKLLMCCDVPRDFPHQRYFEGIKSIVENPKLHGRVRITTPSKSGLDLLEKYVSVKHSQVLPYGVTPSTFYPIPRDVARAAMELRDDGTFLVFSQGRVDTGVMMFASFVGMHPNIKAKLLLPIEEGLTDMVKEMYVNEMSIIGVPEGKALSMLMLMKDTSNMNSEELNVLVAASNVVVHANPISDMNVLAYQFALTGVPQIIPDNTFNTEHFDKSLITCVPTVFDFYSFDEYGGRLSLCNHRDLAAAVSDIMTNCAVTDKAHNLVNYMNSVITKRLSWENWKIALKNIGHHQQNNQCKTDNTHFTSDVDILKSKLSNLLLKIGRD